MTSLPEAWLARLKTVSTATLCTAPLPRRVVDLSSIPIVAERPLPRFAVYANTLVQFHGFAATDSVR